MTFEEFKEKAKAKFGDKYRYIREYKEGTNTYVEYECPEHGIIRQTKHSHLKSKFGCKKCADESYRIYHSNEELIEACNKLHNGKYEYLEVDYTDLQKPMKIKCNVVDEFGKHGIFYQKYSNHYCNKEGCPICGKTHGMTLERFIKKANKVHNFKYTYNNAVYKDAHTKLLITCPEHGDFLQTPNDHLSGYGCPKCRSSHMERNTRKLLTEYKINFEEQKQFDWLIFKKRGRMKFDFYLPDYNIAIECQGEQHFYPIEYYHGKEKFEVIKERDEYKKKLCEKNNVKIEYINYFDNLENKLNEILKNVGAK
jgi:predicted RNA-binding Zn-ribbon protein involved in translation (DUF1610 family)